MTDMLRVSTSHHKQVIDPTDQVEALIKASEDTRGPLRPSL